MERAGLLLVLGILVAALPSAAATFGAQPGATCEPTLLATQVALFCAPDMPTAQCCEPVVAAVDLGGGVPCLCRVAAEPQLIISGLNATHLLTLYTSCGGLRPGGAHLASACEDSAPPAAPVVSECRRDPELLAAELVRWCSNNPESPSAECCVSLAQTIDGGCISLVAEEPELNASELDRSHLVYLYNKCPTSPAGSRKENFEVQE